MVRGVRWCVVGCVVLVALAGCGRGFVQYMHREPWREQAEVACLKSGTVREGPRTAIAFVQLHRKAFKNLDPLEALERPGVVRGHHFRVPVERRHTLGRAAGRQARLAVGG